MYFSRKKASIGSQSELATHADDFTGTFNHLSARRKWIALENSEVGAEKVSISQVFLQAVYLYIDGIDCRTALPLDKDCCLNP